MLVLTFKQAWYVVDCAANGRCNVSILARLELILKPPDYRTSDLRVPDSGLGPPHFGSGNLGLIMHVVHEAYSTYSVVVSSNIIFFPPNKCDRGCASTPACRRTLSARTSEVAPSVASVVLLQRVECVYHNMIHVQSLNHKTMPKKESSILVQELPKSCCPHP